MHVTVVRAAGTQERSKTCHHAVKTDLIGGTILETKTNKIGYSRHVCHRIKELNSNMRHQTAHSGLTSNLSVQGTILRVHSFHHIVQPLLGQLVTLKPDRDAPLTPLDDVAFHLSQLIRKVDHEARTTTHGTRPILRTLDRNCAQSNTDLNRIIVPITRPAQGPLSPIIVIGRSSNLGLSVSVCIRLCQVFPQFCHAGWKGKEVSMHLISRNSINFNRVLTHGFLNPQSFDGGCD